MGRGGAAALVAGFVALVAGVVAAAADLPWLGFVAGVAGAIAAALAVGLARRADAVQERLAATEHRIEELLDEREQAAARPEPAAAPPIEVRVPGEDEGLLDPETGLFAEPYFAVSLTGRVAAARRHLRPVAVVLLEVARGVRDGEPVPAEAALVGPHLRTTLREADTACRLEHGRFGLVLEDTPENGAVWTVERIRRSLSGVHRDLTLWAGVACYPAHAFDAGELRARATAALDAAKQWRQDRIEVATSSE